MLRDGGETAEEQEDEESGQNSDGSQDECHDEAPLLENDKQS
jgi:hypothetical protein